MKVSGEHTFAAARERVYEAFTDPEVLRKVLPGCDEFRETGPEDYHVTITVSLIAFKATVSGDVTITERVPPESYLVKVTGSGSLGSLAVDAVMRLTGGYPSTKVDYELDIQTTGVLMTMGAPVIEPAAKMIMGQFMGSMEKVIAEGTSS